MTSHLHINQSRYTHVNHLENSNPTTSLITRPTLLQSIFASVVHKHALHYQRYYFATPTLLQDKSHSCLAQRYGKNKHPNGQNQQRNNLVRHLESCSHSSCNPLLLSYQSSSRQMHNLVCYVKIPNSPRHSNPQNEFLSFASQQFLPYQNRA